MYLVGSNPKPTVATMKVLGKTANFKKNHEVVSIILFLLTPFLWRKTGDSIATEEGTLSKIPMPTLALSAAKTGTKSAGPLSQRSVARDSEFVWPVAPSS